MMCRGSLKGLVRALKVSVTCMFSIISWSDMTYWSRAFREKILEEKKKIFHLAIMRRYNTDCSSITNLLTTWCL